jgi:hypothetical protein
MNSGVFSGIAGICAHEMCFLTSGEVKLYGVRIEFTPGYIHPSILSQAPASKDLLDQKPSVREPAQASIEKEDVPALCYTECASDIENETLTEEIDSETDISEMFSENGEPMEID